MRILVFLPLVISLISQNQYGQTGSENSSIAVLGAKWSKSRQRIELPDNQPDGTTQKAMTSANKNFERNRRINDPAGAIDPGETPAQAIIREVLEETNLCVLPSRIVGVFGGAKNFRFKYPNGDNV